MSVKYEYGGRDKAVKGFTYPIKRAELDHALLQVGVVELGVVSFVCCPVAEKSYSVINGYFSGDARNPGKLERALPTVWFDAVKSSDCPKIKELLRRQNVLNRFANWLKKIESGENVLRGQFHNFSAVFENDELVIEIVSGYKR
ncbi:hypothetical protein GM415_06400 [Pseudodesulfovibrio cashew]|uniref:Uncharacterized protein n=1 Tax=Pseudodesulfovibrio cashew TaxID=2678688 RepID=A0A6I6JAN0_9BACT|nr:hypothetical protein [Pseudodesulfovibrio cashew]QGY39765.1 hypothetical protein GM415_06400 [Pseudodesulfovibrio cashew]